MIASKTKKRIRFGLIILAAVIVLAAGLLTVNERAIWRVFPGVTSSASVQEFCAGAVAVAEGLDAGAVKEADSRQGFAAGVLMMGITAKSAETAAEGSEADLILTRYTQAVVKCRLLRLQGDLNPFQYHLIKLPYKTGNTALMRAAMSYAQDMAVLPDGFMSKESLEEEYERSVK